MCVLSSSPQKVKLQYIPSFKITILAWPFHCVGEGGGVDRPEHPVERVRGNLLYFYV